MLGTMGACLHLQWAPREQNPEADELANLVSRAVASSRVHGIDPFVLEVAGGPLGHVRRLVAQPLRRGKVAEPGESVQAGKVVRAPSRGMADP